MSNVISILLSRSSRRRKKKRNVPRRYRRGTLVNRRKTYRKLPYRRVRRKNPNGKNRVNGTGTVKLLPVTRVKPVPVTSVPVTVTLTVF